MSEKKISKLEVDYNAGACINKVIYEQFGNATDFSLPRFPADSMMKFYFDSDFDENANPMKFRTFAKFLESGTEKMNSEEKKEAAFLCDGCSPDFSINKPKIKDLKAASIEVTDVTENILLGFPSLSMEVIGGKDKGIWSYHGDRIFQIKVKDADFSEGETKAKMTFTKIGTEKIWEGDKDLIIDGDKITERTSMEDTFLCRIDTNALGRIIESIPTLSNSIRVSFEAVFEVTKEYIGDQKITYQFPFYIYVNNTSYYDPKNKYLCIDKSSRVSIDFGTSSTCAAIDASSIVLVEMSKDGFNKSAYSVYENPTNLMIFNWDEMYDQFEKKKTHPLMLKKHPLSDEHFEEYRNAFNYGHAVKDNQKVDKRTLDSIITELKMIPKYHADGNDNICTPYDPGEIHDIHLECSLESKFADDQTHFDPIAFYGYLLGRAINHPNGDSNRFYTKYSLTYPVKFDAELREQLKNSLTMGLKMSLPKPVRDMKDSKGRSLFSVEMKYPEPVACLGAICESKLKLSDGKPCLFGVYDFGGGTIDFSYGMYRKADIDSEGYENAIELFGTDGDSSFGGELLIKKISYWILTASSNQEMIQKYNIVFEKPSDEQIPDGYSTYIGTSQFAKANIRRIGEAISRPFFEGKETSSKDKELTDRSDFIGDITFSVDGLYSDSGEIPEPVELRVDFDTIQANLKALFEKISKIFIDSMNNVFEQPDIKNILDEYGAEYKSENVKIFLTGNTSRHPLVKETIRKAMGLQKEDDTDNICLIEDKVEGEANAKGMHYRVTPKTAVAIGLLKLPNFAVKMFAENNEKATFRYYVAASSTGGKKILIQRNSTDNSWQRVGVITNNEIKLYFSGILDLENDEQWNYTTIDFDEDFERNVCFIRTTGSDLIEYIALPIGENPTDDGSYDINTIQLK